MRLTRTLLPLGALAMLMTLTLLGVVYCQENPVGAAPAQATLFSRLKEVKFVGIPYSQNGDVVLIAMTEEQQAAYVEVTKKVEEFVRERNVNRKTIQEKLDQARKNSEPPVEVAKLQIELDQSNEMTVSAGYQDFGREVYRVVNVGADFIEIESLRWPGKTDLFPFGEIHKVVFRKDLPKYELQKESRPAPFRRPTP
jgi:hypothetical protein